MSVLYPSKLIRLSAVILALFFISTSHLSAQPKVDTTQLRALSKKIKEKRYWATYPDSLNILAEAGLSSAMEINDQYGVADMNKFLGIYYWSTGNYGKAIGKYALAKELYESLDKSFEAAQMLSNLGMVYTRLNDSEKALSYYQQAILIMEGQPVKDVASIAGTSSSMGLVLRNHGDLKAAKEMFDNALMYYESINDSLNVAGTLTNIGTVYTRKNSYDSATSFNERALKLFDKLKNVRGKIIACNNLGSILLAKNDLKAAAEYFNTAIGLNKNGEFFESQLSTLIGLGDVSIAKSDYAASEKFFMNAYSIAQKKNKSRLIEIYKGLADSYRGMNNYDKALTFYDRHIQLKDSVFNMERAAALSNLRVSFELDKKDAAIRLLEKDNKITVLSRNMIITVALSAVIFLVILIYTLKLKMQRDKKVMVQERQLSEARQAVIQAELNNQKEREQELQRELEFRNRALTTYTLNLVQKNGMLDEVRGVIQDVLKQQGEKEAELKKLIRLIDYSFTLDKDWDGFKTYFEQVHPDFFKKLRENFPQLSATELKLCALIRLSLSIKESASILSISPDSVKVSRHRVRKKLGLTTDDNLTEFILAV